MRVSLQEPWSIGGVEVPTRIVLAPMAGVSIQAFRRQGRRFGAGLVCSEMVSAAGIEHRNERTFGYLRVAGDEHPLAIQIFGADPARDGGRGADGRGRRRGHRRHELRLPGAQGHEDRRRRAPDGGPGARLPGRGRGGGCREGPRDREDAARGRERLPHVPRARAAARRGRRGRADTSSALGASRCTPARPTTRSPRSSSSASTSP